MEQDSGKTGAKLLQHYGSACLASQPDAVEASAAVEMLTAFQPLASVDDSGKAMPTAQRWLKRLKDVTTKSSSSFSCALLNESIQQAPTALFIQNCDGWFNVVSGHLMKQGGLVKELFPCLNELITRSALVPQLKRDIGSNHLPPLFKHLLGFLDSDDFFMDICGVITAAAASYPGCVKGHMDRIRRVCLTRFSHMNIAVRTSAARCVATLALCAGSKDLSELWSTNCDMVLSSIHEMLNQFYYGIAEEKEWTIDSSFEFSSSVAQPQESVVLMFRFQSLLTTLESLVKLSFPTVVKVPINRIMDLFCRVFAVDAAGLMLSDQKRLLFASGILDAIHRSALECLQALIVSLRSPLSVHIPTIFRIIVQTLQRSSGSFVLQHWNVRGCAYTLLHTCCVSYSGAIPVTDAAECVKLLLRDIVEETTTTTLVQRKSTKNSSKRKRVAHTYDTGPVVSSSADRSGGNSGNLVWLTTRALAACASVISSIGSRLQPSVRSKVEAAVVTQLHRLTPAPKAGTRYADPSCRVELYSVLLACMIVPPSEQTLVPLCAPSFFSRGLRDPDIKVVEKCRHSLMICNLHIHPRSRAIRKKVLPGKATGSSTTAAAGVAGNSVGRGGVGQSSGSLFGKAASISSEPFDLQAAQTKRDASDTTAVPTQEVDSSNKKRRVIDHASMDTSAEKMISTDGAQKGPDEEQEQQMQREEANDVDMPCTEEQRLGQQQQERLIQQQQQQQQKEQQQRQQKEQREKEKELERKRQQELQQQREQELQQQQAQMQQQQQQEAAQQEQEEQEQQQAAQAVQQAATDTKSSADANGDGDDDSDMDFPAIVDDEPDSGDE